MSYKTYITEALVCGSRPHNTSDKNFVLFTREAGMLFASAKSVREERSKHRYALQDCSRVRVTLVRGKSGWRVVGTEALKNYYALATTREDRGEVRDALRLLTRFLQGEEPHEELYTDVCTYLEVRSDRARESRKLIFALRTLYALGYIGEHAQYEHFLVPEYDYASLPDLTRDQSLAIENALKRAHIQSHL